MKSSRLLSLLSEISDCYIAEADPEKKHQSRSRILLRWGSLAASLVIVTGAALFALPMLWENDPLPPAESGTETLPPPIEWQETDVETESSGELWVDTRERNDSILLNEELAIEWGWDDLTPLERYTSLALNGDPYSSRGVYLPEEYLGEKVADGILNEEDPAHSLPCEVFAIRDLPTKRVVAVKFEGADGYVVFFSRTYDPPLTLADFMEEYHLTEYLSLTKVRLTQNNFFAGYFHLSADQSNTIWAMLTEAGDAEIIRDDTFYHDLSTHVTFTVEAPAFGLTNKAYRITSDGYLITNLGEYGYYYPIGADLANRIIELVTEHHGDPVEEKLPYTLVGTITEIGEDFFKLDDTALMKHPEDGMVFTISSAHPHVSRMLRRGFLRVGSTVVVEYDGVIYAHDPTCVGGAFAVHKAIITSGGEVLIPE